MRNFIAFFVCPVNYYLSGPKAGTAMLSPESALSKLLTVEVISGVFERYNIAAWANLVPVGYIRN